MSLDALVTDAAYSTLVADDATYADSFGDEHSVRVVQEHDQATLIGAEVSVRGATIAFRMRKSELETTPKKGERLLHDGTTYCVDGAPIDLNTKEWLIYVVA